MPPPTRDSINDVYKYNVNKRDRDDSDLIRRGNSIDADRLTRFRFKYQGLILSRNKPRSTRSSLDHKLPRIIIKYTLNIRVFSSLNSRNFACQLNKFVHAAYHRRIDFQTTRFAVSISWKWLMRLGV